MSNYQHRKFMTEKEKEFYVNLIKLCPDGFSVFPKIKLAEIIKPIADFGSEKFISEFKELNKITIDFAIFDISNNYTIAIINYQEDGSFNESKISFLNQVCSNLNVAVYQFKKITDLYLVDVFQEGF